jgi:hypothetical protein
VIEAPQLADLLEDAREGGEVLGEALGWQIDAEDVSDEVDPRGLAHGALRPSARGGRVQGRWATMEVVIRSDAR